MSRKCGSSTKREPAWRDAHAPGPPDSRRSGVRPRRGRPHGGPARRQVPRLRPVQVRTGAQGEGGPAAPAFRRVQGDPPQAEDRQGRLRHQGPSRHPVPGGRRPGQGDGPVPGPRGEPRLHRAGPADTVRGASQGPRHGRPAAAAGRQVDVDDGGLDAQTEGPVASHADARRRPLAEAAPARRRPRRGPSPGDRRQSPAAGG